MSAAKLQAAVEAAVVNGPLVAHVLCKISTPALIMRRDRVVSAPKQQAVEAAVAAVEAAMESVVANAPCKISACSKHSNNQ